ncbi:uncharacterized protein [Triticum aestivum]|uniref:uncharacterized protein isoform X3 n=1 Tax=Triticum aestivum TaxID=4565 RepID=UPI001D01FAE8|nr:uncharacterized protein LOC123113530 isoform X3 [Triticum aestivum]XP_044390738.1 uncharacterized protein LOC123113530 isoform X3 [Triticum aestivum]
MGLQEKRPIQMNRIPRPPIPHFVPSLHLTSAPWPPPSSNFLAGATRPKSFRHRSPSTLPTSTTAPTLAASHLRRTTPPNTASLDAMIVPRAPCSRSGLNLPYQGSFVEAAATLWKEGQGKTCLRYLVVWNMSSLELGTCSHMPYSKSESVRVRALFYARVCVCFGSGASPWMLKTMRSAYLFFMKFSQGKKGRTSLRMSS